MMLPRNTILRVSAGQGGKTGNFPPRFCHITHPEGQIWLSVLGHLGAAEAFPVKIRDKTKVEDG